VIAGTNQRRGGNGKYFPLVTPLTLTGTGGARHLMGPGNVNGIESAARLKPFAKTQMLQTFRKRIFSRIAGMFRNNIFFGIDQLFRITAVISEEVSYSGTEVFPDQILSRNSALKS
jgi:hypothetical protein